MSGEHEISLGTYYKVFFALLGLMALTMLVPYMPIGHSYEIWATLLVSTVKAVLIVTYFMHLKHASRWIVLLFCSSVWMLLVGFAILFSDYTTRY